MKPISINDLPAELVLQNQIFKRLSLTDLVRIKRVCRLWNVLISNMRIDRLFADADLDVSERWFHSNRPCSESELCYPDLFVAQCKKPMLSNLKHLKLNNRICWNNKLNAFNPNRLNAFRQLVQLEIDYYLGNELYLCLQNLVVLSLNWGNNKCRIRLNLPKLRVLGYDEYESKDLLRVDHPDTIRVLESQMFGAKLARFKNVECLKCPKYDHGFLDSSTLLNLKQLKEVHYDMAIDCFAYDGYEELMQAMKEFMRQRRCLGRSNLKVYFAGLLLIEEDLSDIDFGLEIKNAKYLVSQEGFYMKHYNRLKSNMDLVGRVDYSRLFELVDVLPADYFDRFNGIRVVGADRPVDEQHFLNFLKQLYCLKWLSLSNSDLTQSFFDTLPEFCSLTHLYLFSSRKTKDDSAEDEESEDEIQLNFNFMGKFVKLYHVGISKGLSLESIRSFVPAFENLRETMDRKIKFEFRGDEFTLGRNRPDYDENGNELVMDRTNQYYLLCRKKLLLDYVSLDQVIDFFEKPENLENLSDSDS